MGGYVAKIEDYFYPTNNSLNLNEQTILDLKTCRDKIKTHIKRLKNVSRANRIKAKTLVRQNQRSNAKILLKKAKISEVAVDDLINQVGIIEDQIHNINMSLAQKETFDVLKSGNSLLNEIQKDISVQKFEEVGEDMRQIKESLKEVALFLKIFNVKRSEFDSSVEEEMKNLEFLFETKIEESKPADEKKNSTISIPEKKEEKSKELIMD